MFLGISFIYFFILAWSKRRWKYAKCQRYFLDEIDGVVYSTNDYTLWNFYRSIFYGKPFKGEISGAV